MPRVRRYDRAPLSGARRTDEGFLVAPANLTRIGVLEYLNPDGSVRREIRLPQDVFAAESLATYDRKPVTRDHPAEKVSAENARALMIGVASNPHRADDGQHVAAEVTIYDAETIRAVDRGERELSPGYDVREEPIPGGEWTDAEGAIGPAGRTYKADLFQRDIVANHIAIVPRARAGSTASIRLDSAGNQVPSQEQPVKKIMINGVEFEVSEALAEAIAKIQADATAMKADMDALKAGAAAAAPAADKAKEEAARADSLKSELERARGDKAALESQLAEAKKRLDKIDADQKAAEHKALCERVKPHLGETVEQLQRLDALELKKRVVAKLAPAVKLDGVSADFVNGVFETSLASPRADAADLAALAAQGTREAVRADGDEDPVTKAQSAYEASVRNAWKPKA